MRTTAHAAGSAGPVQQARALYDGLLEVRAGRNVAVIASQCPVDQSQGGLLALDPAGQHVALLSQRPLPGPRLTGR